MKILLVLCFVAILSTGVFGQRSSVVGAVVDPNGASLDNVEIEATGKDGKTWRTSSNADGSYKLELSDGSYTFTFSHGNGFLMTIVTNYLIPPKTAMHLDILLEIDLESPTAMISELICDKNGKCDYVSRHGRGTSRPKEIAFTSQTIETKKKH